MLIDTFDMPSTGSRGKKTVGWAHMKCDHCNSLFEIKCDSRYRRLKYHFCQKECSKNAKKLGGCLFSEDGQIRTKFDIIDGVKKQCLQCQNEFVDMTIRQNRKACSQKCITALCVATKCKNGTNTLTDEHKKRIGSKIRDMWKSGQIFLTEEALKSRSEKTKASWADGRQQKKARETCQKKYGVDFWSQTDEGRAEISKKVKTCWADEEHQIKRIEACRKKYGVDNWSQTDTARKLMKEKTGERMRSRSRDVIQNMQSKRWKTLQSHGYSLPNWGRGKGGKRSDLENVYFRSTWEANVARMFNYLKYEWQYEPTVIDLPGGKTYTPDFYVCIDGEWTWVEVKGYQYSGYMEKWQQFREMKLFSCEKIALIDVEQYKKYELQYSTIIDNWESKCMSRK